jgi:hypothetical protein
MGIRFFKSNKPQTEFMRSTPAIDKAMNEAASASELREALDHLLAEEGIPTRGTAGTYDRTADAEVPNHQSSSPAAAAVESGGQGHLVRIIYVGNSRFEFYSDSESGLDSQENAIRALYR